jgi:hypothetical protein
MKLNGREYEVGVRALQDRLGAYLELVEQGGERR